MTGNNYIVQNPIGVDKAIQDIQDFIFENLDWNDCSIYGRIFKLESDKGISPRAFVSGKDYKDIFTNDRQTASIYFNVDDKQTTKEGLLFTAKVQIVFMVNLKKINSNSVDRADTEIQTQAIKTVNKIRDFNFNGSIDTGLKNVFKNFDVSRIPKVDMQPYHVFSLSGEIQYNLNDGCFKN